SEDAALGSRPGELLPVHDGRRPDGAAAHEVGLSGGATELGLLGFLFDRVHGDAVGARYWTSRRCLWDGVAPARMGWGDSLQVLDDGTCAARVEGCEGQGQPFPRALPRVLALRAARREVCARSAFEVGYFGRRAQAAGSWLPAR